MVASDLVRAGPLVRATRRLQQAGTATLGGLPQQFRAAPERGPDRSALTWTA